MSTIRRIEKFFSYIGDFCLIVGATILLIIMGDYAIGAARYVENFIRSGGEEGALDRRFASPVYNNLPEEIEYWKEFREVWGTHFEPYFHYKRNAFSGKHINIDADGVRLTPKPSGVPGEIKVFVLGGSTTWGTGSADSKTIPSILQSLLGDRYDVYNYGESAFVSAQELNYLLYQLARGNIPDVVIFYDGVNDGYAGAYSPSIPRDHESLRFEGNKRKNENLAYTYYKNSNYNRLINFILPSANYAAWDQEVAPKIAENSKAVIDVYEAHIKQVKALAKEYGFKAYFFWQPNLLSLTRKPFNDYEQAVIEDSSPVMIESQQRVFQAAIERFSGREDENIHFLGHIFDETAEPIYIDWHHVGPLGNKILAKEMLRLMNLSADEMISGSPIP